MAYCDYQHCAVCDAKTFYDANIDWTSTNVEVDEAFHAPLSVESLCADCAKTHELLVVVRTSDRAPVAVCRTVAEIRTRIEKADAGDTLIMEHGRELLAAYEWERAHATRLLAELEQLKSKTEATHG